jgi:GNAT superfamily N-acetyltransferase
VRVEASVVRRAEPGDVEEIFGLVRELARFEGDEARIVASVGDFRRALFPGSGDTAVWCQVGLVDPKVVGATIWYRTFSTWTGTFAVRMVDLVVSSNHRRTGIGRQLMAAVAAECLAHRWNRMHWMTARWNEGAIRFYQRLGAVAEPADDEYLLFSLDASALAALAGENVTD